MDARQSVPVDAVLRIAEMSGPDNTARCHMMLVCWEWHRALCSPQAHQAWSPGKKQIMCRVNVADLRQVHALFRLSKSDIKNTAPLPALAAAAVAGRVDLIMFIHQTWDLTPDDARQGANYVLRMAAQYGRVNVLRFLVGTYQLTAEDASACYWYAFREASRNGHVEVLRFMADAWDISATCIPVSCMDDAVAGAAHNSHVSVLEFLADRCGISITRISWHCAYDVLRTAACRGNVAVLKFLAKSWRFPLTEKNSNFCLALREIIENMSPRHAHKFITITWPLIADDMCIRSSCKYFTLWANKRYGYEMMQRRAHFHEQ